MTATTAEPRFLNIFDPTFDPESAEVAEARETHWYAHTPGPPLVLRYEPARSLLGDPRFIHGAHGYMESHGVFEGPTYDWWKKSMMSLAKDDHARVRGAVQRSFTPKRVEDLRDFARETAENLIDEHLAQGQPCEFTEFSRRYPAMIMCRLLGVPPEDYDEFSEGSSDIGLAFSRQITPDQLPQIDAAIVGLGEYATSLIDRRRRDPGDDLLSSLTTHDELTPEELHNLTVLLIWGGQDTTHCQLGRAMTVFAEHPDQWELLAEQPELVGQAVEEVIRWSPQARMMWRLAVEPVTIDDLEVPAETMVFMSVVAAHRDPRAFTPADRFDITAEHRSPHLGFSHGMHHCLGAAIARLESAEALKALTRRLGPPRVAGDVEWRAPSAAIHGPEVLPLEFASRT